jgi:hypothetical protein
MTDLEPIETFIHFSKTATTKSGLAFSLDVFEWGMTKTKHSKGKSISSCNVFSGKIPIAMHGDLKGTALLLGQQYDLVTEDPFV